MVMIISFRIPLTPKHTQAVQSPKLLKTHLHLKSKMHLKQILNVVIFTFLLMNKRHYSFLHHSKKTNTSPLTPLPQNRGKCLTKNICYQQALRQKLPRSFPDYSIFFLGLHGQSMRPPISLIVPYLDFLLGSVLTYTHRSWQLSAE